MRLVARGKVIDLSRPVVMGIVNLVGDSFSGDGLTDVGAALDRARQMTADGAGIIDIGAESARTNRSAISEDEEAAQLIRFIAAWDSPVPLSINTWRPSVVKRVLSRGGDLLNDIGGLPTDENARLCAEAGAALLIMHTVGEPKVPHTHVAHADIIEGLKAFFRDKIGVAEAAGIQKESLVLDPGIDFAKQREDNLRIFRELDQLTEFGRPILLPVSRKTVVGDVLGLAPADRDAGTIACLVSGALRGAHIFRVHNVKAAAQALQILAAVENPNSTPPA